MTYELAKQLKEAGFPQREWGESDFVLCQHNNGKVHDYDDTCEVIVIPTLSELIEACGAGYFHLSRRDEIWKAEHPHKTLRLLVEAKGLSPDEAVANLWLALNPVMNKEEIPRNPLDQNKWM